MAFAVLLAALSMIGPFSIDTYLPSFPAIQADLQVSSVQMQQTLSVYLLTFAIMTLFHGTLSDSFGRRPIVLVNLLVFVLASPAAPWRRRSSSYSCFAAFRVCQPAPESWSGERSSATASKGTRHNA